MFNPLKLIPGKKYEVIRAFTDYDKILHPVGETWTFVRTNFLPYEDGLTLHVTFEDSEKEFICRLQWRSEEQSDIIDHFLEFVGPI